MKVQILGTGCSKCRLLEDHVRQALHDYNITAEIEKVTNIDDIMAMGVMMTPALAIDGVVKSVGRVLTKEQLLPFLKGEK